MRKKEEGAVATGASESTVRDMRSLGISTHEYALMGDYLQGLVGSKLAPGRRIIRLFHCFGCGRDKALKMFTRCLLVCKDCYHECGSKGKVAKRNYRERVVSRVKGYLGRAL